MMTADEISGHKDMKSVDAENDDAIDIDKFRRLIRSFIDLRRYQTALFWSEKVVQLSKNDPKDVYWLAQCMFLSKEYHRAAHVIKIRGLEKTNIMCHYLLVESLLEAKEYQEALEILNTVDADELSNKTWTNKSNDSTTIEETDEILKNEVLASINFLKGKVLEAIDNRASAMDFYVNALQKSVYCTEALDALVQHEMLLACEEHELLAHLPINKQCSKPEAVIVRKLYESKIKKYYDGVLPQTMVDQPPSVPSHFVKQYTAKLKADTSNKTIKTEKLTNPKLLTPSMQKIMSPANKILNDIRSTPSISIHSSLIKGEIKGETIDNSTKYKITKVNINSSINLQLCNERLENSIDLLVAKAEKYFYNCEYNKCMKILDYTLKSDPYHIKVLTIQIGCLVELKETNKLFYVAHKLVDLYPDQAISWYAVGCYYDIIGKSDPARRYLSKATSLDRLFGPAWLAYGHSFARENEHDQAMAAYFKATQLMRGCHLPLLYIGVECGLTKNRDLAEQFFYQAMEIAPLDVFVLHELGVIKFEYNEYREAEEVFRATLEMVRNIALSNNESVSSRWEPLLNNLGHCCRKNKKYNEALAFHRRALIYKPQSAPTYTAIGFVQALMGNLDDAVDSLHKSLSLKRDDVVATTLLKYAIEDLMEQHELPDSIANEVFNPDCKRETMIEQETKLKNNWVKLRFEDVELFESSQNSDMGDTNFDMSMDD